jgi:DNA polymerase epsilon subunit 1
MRVGVYRSDIKETFQLEPSAFQQLLNECKGTCDFFLKEEEKVKIEDVANYEETVAEVERQLRALCDPAKVQAQLGRTKQDSQPDDYTLKLVEYEVIEGSGGVKSGGKKIKKSSHRVIKDEFPFIYHLDVGAMYPNIILSHRLQPSAIVTKEFCAACAYDDPSNNCKHYLDWKWRGELYMATRADVKSITQEMENDKRRYDKKDKEGNKSRVKWGELPEAQQTTEILKAVREFSQKAYRRVKSSWYEHRTDIVCQRENPFYVNTVLNFRDRRYVFKRQTKEWNKKLEKANESGDMEKITEAKGMVLLNDSLQLAHKCI